MVNLFFFFLVPAMFKDQLFFCASIRFTDYEIKVMTCVLARGEYINIR